MVTNSNYFLTIDTWNKATKCETRRFYLILEQILGSMSLIGHVHAKYFRSIRPLWIKFNSKDLHVSHHLKKKIKIKRMADPFWPFWILLCDWPWEAKLWPICQLWRSGLLEVNSQNLFNKCLFERLQNEKVTP